MKKKISSENVENNSSSTQKNINYYNNWIIIITSWLISMTLIISWVLWILFFKKNTKELLGIIDKIITNHGISFNLTFPTLTIAVLGFGFVILGIVTFPFIFFKKNDFISLLLARIMLLISLLLIIGSILFVAFGYLAFYDYVISKSISNILFFIIPWSLEVFYSIILIFFCLFFIKKNRQKKYLHIQNKIDEKYSMPAINISKNISDGSTNSHNESQAIIWTAQQIEEVWNKGEIIDNFNPKLYRKDYAGSLMFWHNFLQQAKLNDEVENLNWTIVYEKPLSAGGSNYIKNLVPMNNNNAISKGNSFPHWTTAVTYDNKKNKNIFKKKSWKYKSKE